MEIFFISVTKETSPAFLAALRSVKMNGDCIYFVQMTASLGVICVIWLVTRLSSDTWPVAPFIQNKTISRCLLCALQLVR